MFRRNLALAIALSALTLTGCDSQSVTGAVLEPGTLQIVNLTNWTFRTIAFADCMASGQPGSNRLDRTLGPNEATSFDVTPGSHAAVITTTDGRTLWAGPAEVRRSRSVILTAVEGDRLRSNPCR
jgi:hypothetical protein